MNWQGLLNAALTAVLSGAVDSAVQYVNDPHDGGLDLKRLGGAAAVGALIGLANHLRQSPQLKKDGQ